LYQLNVKHVFLHGDILEDIYIGSNHQGLLPRGSIREMCVD